jgi:predicted  nucleic acid-binding Zn-ribbon protein
VETIRKQIQALKTENERNHDQTGTIDLTEINEALCAELDRVKARLLAYEEGTEVQQELSNSEVPELLGRYRKLGKRFSAVTKVSEHLNELIDNAHCRNQRLESEISSLRTENLSLSEQLCQKDKSNQKFAEETERVIAEHAEVFGRLDDS